MDSIYEATLLFDFYGELLTENQRNVCRMHVLEDYSLAEIAELTGVSRQGVHDSLKRAEKSLCGYEDTLHLVERFLHIRTLAIEAKNAQEPDRTRLLDEIIQYTMEIE